MAPQECMRRLLPLYYRDSGICSLFTVNDLTGCIIPFLYKLVFTLFLCVVRIIWKAQVARKEKSRKLTGSDV